MKSAFKRYFEGNKYLPIISIVIVIALVATFLLNNFISEEINRLNRGIALHSLQKKHHDLEQEFQLLQKPLIDAKRLMSRDEAFLQQYENVMMLQATLFFDSMVYRNWLYLKQDDEVKNLLYNSRSDDRSVFLPRQVNDSGAVSLDRKMSTIIKGNDDGWLWRNEIKIPVEKGIVYFGYDLDLKSVQRLFWNIDSYSLSYAYVFDQRGLCVLHPDATKIGENVFQFTSLSVEDTIVGESGFRAKMMNSEYLQLPVVSYLKALYVSDDRWFIAVNFPKNINEQDINVIKNYSFLIYGISTVLLLFVFYFFSYRLRKEFKEKEQLQLDKTALALENEVFERKSAFFQLQQLKNQLNPHLLFNSLNTLYALIDKDQNLTKEFTHKLSKLYRYLTDKPENNLCIVRDEIKVVEEFLFMQKIRFGDRLLCQIHILNEQALEREVPFLSVQTVVENAIKHNIATNQQPLSIQIHIDLEGLVIRNNYQPKNVFEQRESKLGLRYLRSIYQYYKKEGFSTYIEDDCFVCELPLL